VSGRSYRLAVLGAVVLAAAPARADRKAEPDRPQTVAAKLVEKSKLPTPKSIAPYRDAMVAFAYELPDAGGRARVCHWAIRDGVVQDIGQRKVGTRHRMQLRPLERIGGLEDVARSDTLDLPADAPAYVQVDQKLKLPAPADGDYGNGLTHRMRALHALRGQLGLVAWGDSRTDCGVDASAFFGGDTAVPRAYNLSIASSGVMTLAWLADHYLPPLPRLRWVVVGFAPRMLSRTWGGCHEFRGGDGPAWSQDVKTGFERWRRAPAVPLTLQQVEADRSLRWSSRPWGGQKVSRKAFSMDEARRLLEREPPRPRWEFDALAWLHLKRILRDLDGRGVNVLLFTPPTHPIYGPTPVTSEDLISNEGAGETLDRLRDLQKELGHLFVLDINRRARHDYPAELFRDNDHLNAAGREKLSEFLEAKRRECKPRPSRRPSEVDPAVELNITRTTQGLTWARARLGERVYVDRKYALRTLPDRLKGAQMLRTRNDDKHAAEDETLVAFHVDRRVRVWLAVPGDGDPLPGWAAEWEIEREGLATDRAKYLLLWRDVPSGRVEIAGPGRESDGNYFVLVRPLKGR